MKFKPSHIHVYGQVSTLFNKHFSLDQTGLYLDVGGSGEEYISPTPEVYDKDLNVASNTRIKLINSNYSGSPGLLPENSEVTVYYHRIDIGRCCPPVHGLDQPYGVDICPAPMSPWAIQEMGYFFTNYLGIRTYSTNTLVMEEGFNTDTAGIYKAQFTVDPNCQTHYGTKEFTVAYGLNPRDIGEGYYATPGIFPQCVAALRKDSEGKPLYIEPVTQKPLYIQKYLCVEPDIGDFSIAGFKSISGTFTESLTQQATTPIKTPQEVAAMTEEQKEAYAMELGDKDNGFYFAKNCKVAGSGQLPAITFDETLDWSVRSDDKYYLETYGKLPDLIGYPVATSDARYAYFEFTKFVYLRAPVKPKKYFFRVQPVIAYPDQRAYVEVFACDSHYYSLEDLVSPTLTDGSRSTRFFDVNQAITVDNNSYGGIPHKDYVLVRLRIRLYYAAEGDIRNAGTRPCLAGLKIEAYPSDPYWDFPELRPTQKQLRDIRLFTLR